MFWWFERRGQFIRCEAGESTEGGFELHILTPDGTERIERFASSTDLARRQAEFEREIAAEGWTGPHGRNL